MALERSERYPEISPKAWQHPADRAATSAIAAIPLMDKAIKRLTEIAIDRRYRQVLLGNAVRVGPDQIPDLWAVHRHAADVLDHEPVPALYVTQTPLANAMAVGSKAPVVIVYSGLVSSYEPDEVSSVLAHEMGHVASEHNYYTTALVLLTTFMSGALPRSLLAGLPIRAVYLALLEWSRAAELSSDRASAIVMGDPLVTCRMLMRMAGGSLPGMSLDAFITQATEYAEDDDLFSRHSRFWIEVGQTHPFAVRRVKELIEWVSEGDLDRIRGGSYLRRGQEAPPSEEFDAAVTHYRERFARVVERTLGGVQRISDQLGDWLRRRPGEGEDDGEVDDWEE